MATNVRQMRIDVATEQRRADRLNVIVSRASVRGLGEQPAAAQLLDVSIYGCRIAAGAAHAAGDRLWLRLDGGWPIPATVVWNDGERLGCRFDQPIAGGVMRELTRSRHEDRGVSQR